MEAELKTMIEDEVAGIWEDEIVQTRTTVLENGMARGITHLLDDGLWITLGHVYGPEDGSEDIREAEALMAEMLGKRMGGEVSIKIVDHSIGGASRIEVTVLPEEDE